MSKEINVNDIFTDLSGHKVIVTEVGRNDSGKYIGFRRLHISVDHARMKEESQKNPGVVQVYFKSVLEQSSGQEPISRFRRDYKKVE